MSHLLFCALGLCVLMTTPPIAAAADPEDPAIVGSRWEGFIKVVRIERRRAGFRTSDAQLKITKRDGENFTGELTWGRGMNVIQLVGVIERNGTVKFTVSKVLRGERAPHLVANARFLGRLKDNAIRGRYTIPNTRKYGEIAVKLK
jgi:hypothetical protein